MTVIIRSTAYEKLTKARVTLQLCECVHVPRMTRNYSLNNGTNKIPQLKKHTEVISFKLEEKSRVQQMHERQDDENIRNYQSSYSP